MHDPYLETVSENDKGKRFLSWLAMALLLGAVVVIGWVSYLEGKYRDTCKSTCRDQGFNDLAVVLTTPPWNPPTCLCANIQSREIPLP